jgi:hypothetical protein
LCGNRQNLYSSPWKGEGREGVHDALASNV